MWRRKQHSDGANGICALLWVISRGTVIFMPEAVPGPGRWILATSQAIV